MVNHKSSDGDSIHLAYFPHCADEGNDAQRDDRTQVSLNKV